MPANKIGNIHFTQCPKAVLYFSEFDSPHSPSFSRAMHTGHRSFEFVLFTKRYHTISSQFEVESVAETLLQLLLQSKRMGDRLNYRRIFWSGG